MTAASVVLKDARDIASAYDGAELFSPVWVVTGLASTWEARLHVRHGSTPTAYVVMGEGDVALPGKVEDRRETMPLIRGN